MSTTDTANSPKGESINSMFADIAGRYDFANHVLSGGVDYYWRCILVKLVKATSPQDVIDLATGSGDVAFALRQGLSEETKITGMDFCAPMLEEARKKQSQRNIEPAIQFTHGDCMDLPLEDKSTDAITIAFGVRNFEDRQRGLKEMLRVLRPGGSLFILEFSQPQAWFRPFYYFYLKNFLPFIAGWATGKKDAYQYLAGSIEEFPAREVLAEQIKEAGFSKVTAHPLTFGIVAIHQATK